MPSNMLGFNQRLFNFHSHLKNEVIFSIISPIVRKSHSDVAHYLKVKEKLDSAMQAAIIGGGQKRIEAQHKKVINVICKLSIFKT